MHRAKAYTAEDCTPSSMQPGSSALDPAAPAEPNSFAASGNQTRSAAEQAARYMCSESASDRRGDCPACQSESTAHGAAHAPHCMDQHLQ